MLVTGLEKLLFSVIKQPPFKTQAISAGVTLYGSSASSKPSEVISTGFIVPSGDISIFFGAGSPRHYSAVCHSMIKKYTTDLLYSIRSRDCYHRDNLHCCRLYIPFFQKVRRDCQQSHKKACFLFSVNI